MVVALKGNKVNVTFVDYGCSLILNHKDIFKLPSAALRIPILGHQFNLSGLNDANFNDANTKQMVDLFSEIVTNVEIILKVVPTDGMFG